MKEKSVEVAWKTSEDLIFFLIAWMKKSVGEMNEPESLHLQRQECVANKREVSSTKRILEDSGWSEEKMESSKALEILLFYL